MYLFRFVKVEFQNNIQQTCKMSWFHYHSQVHKLSHLQLARPGKEFRTSNHFSPKKLSYDNNNVPCFKILNQKM